MVSHALSSVTPKRLALFASAGLICGLVGSLPANDISRVDSNRVVVVKFISEKPYQNPFTEVTLDSLVTTPAGQVFRIPGYWAGENRWEFRYASSLPGEHDWTLECSDKENKSLHGPKGKILVTPYQGDNPLYQHGPLRVAGSQRHFEHQDGRPFLWLADTWWKGLSKRLSWEDFQTLAADRKAKGFNAVQIVCGPYPDEAMMEARWENEGGKPYLKQDFSEINPAYFDHADRRISHLADSGIVPVIVGGWGRPQGGGKSTLMQVGLEGYQRHWRNLVARYGAYPVVWIVGGEVKDSYGPWSELASYLRRIDPYKRMICYHAPGHPRSELKDSSMFDFDMAAIGHNGMKTAADTLNILQGCLEATPKRPALCGEACYEGHMQTNFQDVQRYMFWTFMLNGAAGHTYGAAGIWHAGIEGDAGHTGLKGQEYDFTTWQEAMVYPGATQVGLGKKLLEIYPWSRFETHPEWVEQGNFAAGIPGQVRFIYMPRQGLYNWNGPLVKNLDPAIRWRVRYVDPASGRTFDQGIVEPTAKPGDSSAKPAEFRKNVPSPQDWLLIFERFADHK